MPSTLPDSLEALLLVGVATKLATWDIVTYTDEGEYSPTDVRPAYLGPSEPAGSPDERLLLTARPGIPLRGSARLVDVPIGFNWRGAVDGAPEVGLQFLGLLKRRFTRLGPTTFGEIPVNGVTFGSGGMLGRDANRRQGASATYLFRCREANANS